MKKILLTLIALSFLSACVDADFRMDVHDNETATLSADVTVGPQASQLVSASGQPPCNGGVITQLGNGGYQCVVEETDTIDSIVAKIEDSGEVLSPQGISAIDSAKIERIGGGLMRVSLDFSDLKDRLSKMEMPPEQLAMAQQEFSGHEVSLTIAGPRIVETNGALSSDGKSAKISIQLDKLLALHPSLPETFVTVLQTE